MDWNEAKKNGLGRFTFEIRVRGFRVLSQLERRLSCHVPGFKSAHPAVPVTNTQLCIMRIMLNHVLCKGARVSVQPFTIRRPPCSHTTDRHRINRLAPGSARNLSKVFSNDRPTAGGIE